MEEKKLPPLSEVHKRVPNKKGEGNEREKKKKVSDV